MIKFKLYWSYRSSACTFQGDGTPAHAESHSLPRLGTSREPRAERDYVTSCLVPGLANYTSTKSTPTVLLSLMTGDARLFRPRWEPLVPQHGEFPSWGAVEGLERCVASRCRTWCSRERDARRGGIDIGFPCLKGGDFPAAAVKAEIAFQGEDAKLFCTESCKWARRQLDKRLHGEPRFILKAKM